jgi:SAM-dependent methyltransferase
MKYCASTGGKILDLGCGKNPYYHKYFAADAVFTKADIRATPGVDLIIDLEKMPLPVEGISYDHITFFHLLCLLKNPENLIKDTYRILKPGGKIIFTSMFVIPVRPEPKDYNRWTNIKIEETLIETGFRNIQIHPVGERFSVCANLLISPLPFKGFFAIFKLPFYYLALFLDKIIPRGVLKSHPCPIGYFCIAEK